MTHTSDPDPTPTPTTIRPGSYWHWTMLRGLAFVFVAVTGLADLALIGEFVTGQASILDVAVTGTFLTAILWGALSVGTYADERRTAAIRADA